MAGEPEKRAELPPSVALAWGRRPASGRGPRPGLSVERIVAAAVRVAEREGLAAVSMSRVAAELGSSPMSLYRHVASKDELLLLMTDLPLEKPPVIDAAADWRDRLSGWAHAYRTLLHRNPWVVRVPISGPPITPNNVAWFEAGLQALAGTALTEDEKVAAVLLVSTHVRSDAQLVGDIEAAGSNSDNAAVLASYGEFLRALIDPEEHPALHRVVQAGVFDAQTTPDDSDFEFGLRTIVNGLETLMDSRS